MESTLHTVANYCSRMQMVTELQVTKSNIHVKAYIRCHTIYLDFLGKTVYGISVCM